MTPQAYCQDVLDRRAPEWRVMLSFTPAGTRSMLEALYALRVEIEDLAIHAVEPGVAATKLQWWRDGLSAYPETHDHPILVALAQAGGKPLDRSRLLTWCDGWGSELQYREIEDERDLDDLLMRRGGHFGALVADALDRNAALAGQHWGVLAAWPRHLLRLPRQAAQGHVELPVAWLHDAGLTPMQLAATPPETPVQTFYGRLIQQVEQRLEHLQTTQPSRPALLPHRLELALAMQRLARWRHRQFEASAAQQAVPPIRRLGILWQAARRHRRALRQPSHFQP
ncbi:squalene/phytoene synthase family protein [Candidatus Macondimonas diazotrophica]|jgi:phytoene synthase|nr:squalene/phytoene synthase family protein [Candidatus Macondimonas diazotrophica]